MSEESNGVVTPSISPGVGNEGSSRQAGRFFQTPRRRGADYYDTLLWRLVPADTAGEDLRFAVGITGCGSRAGASTVAANVAIRAADHGLGPVLLVDANFARPRLDRVFRLREALGLGDILAGQCELPEALHESNIPGLTVMPIGSRGIVDRVSVDQQRVDALMTELLDQYQFVVLDLPECGEFRHSLLLARRLDATLMVVRSEGLRKRRGQDAVVELQRDGVNVVGAVLTQQKTYIPGWFQRWV